MEKWEVADPLHLVLHIRKGVKLQNKPPWNGRDFNAEDAVFKLPEMAHNLPPTLAISALMPKVPRKAIAWMVYTLAQIDARTAQSLGMVSAVVPAAQLESALAETVTTMTARSAPALIAVKDYLRSAPMMEPRGAAAYGVALLSGVLTSANK